MTIYRTLLVGFILALAGCSKKPPLAATPPQQPPIPAVELIEPHIRFQFAVYYLLTPNGDPLRELDAALKADFPEILRLKEIPRETNTISLAARLNEDVAKTYAPLARKLFSA